MYERHSIRGKHAISQTYSLWGVQTVFVLKSLVTLKDESGAWVRLEIENTEKTSKWDPQNLLGAWVGLEQEVAVGNPFFEPGREDVSMNEDGFVGAAQGDRGNQKTMIVADDQ